MTETFVAGLLRSPHGLSGELKAESTSGEVEHLLSLRAVALRLRDGTPVTMDVERVTEHGSGLYVKLSGVDSPEAAAVYTGAEILVDRGRACPLRSGQVYVEDLKGCGLFHGGVKLGVVKDVLDIGAGSVLETLLTDGGRTALVPFKEQFIGTVDVAAGALELKVPWILD